MAISCPKNAVLSNPSPGNLVPCMGAATAANRNPATVLSGTGKSEHGAIVMRRQRKTSIQGVESRPPQAQFSGQFRRLNKAPVE
ncbi:hypothetical protein [Devosia sp.]|uniref:hypothetical protein n=1 Tax=Devosia sp. TaxID=1871048 RepID=UPI001A0C641B|nr:hypothetical protein [Devosia sp.]MBE0579697.1 hypothetical protein [Devosia sp.]